MHLKLFKDKWISKALTLYNYIWQKQTLSCFQPSAVNIYLLHGNCLEIIEKAKKNGAMIIGEAVNLHPRILDQLLKDEAQELGLPYKIDQKIVNKKSSVVLLCDYIITPSTAVKDSYVISGFPEDRIKILPYGSIFFTVKEKNHVSRSNGDKLKIVTVGQIMLRKGQYRMLSALRDHMNKYEVTLIGRESPEYLEKIKEINPIFFHKSHLKHSELLHNLSDFDVFVLPSIEDGFAVVVMEALSAGLPVLVSKYAGSSEIIKEFGGGLVYDPKDNLDFLNKLEKIAIGKYPSLKIMPKSWEDYAQDLIDFTKSISHS